VTVRVSRWLSAERIHDVTTCFLAVLCYCTLTYLMVTNTPVPPVFSGIVGVITGYYFRSLTAATVARGRRQPTGELKRAPPRRQRP
jgi:hypothetical protein